MSPVSQTPETLVHTTITVCALRDLHPLLLVQSLLTVHSTSEPLTPLPPLLSVITGRVMLIEKKNHLRALFNTNSPPPSFRPFTARILTDMLYTHGSTSHSQGLTPTMPATQKAPRKYPWNHLHNLISTTDPLSPCATFASHPRRPFNSSLELPQEIANLTPRLGTYSVHASFSIP